MAFLTLADAGPDAERFSLDADEIVLGRHPDCDVVVDVGAVSRHHAKIRRRDGQHWVEDLKSRNGTFLNGQLLRHPELLRESDRIRICDVEFEYREGERITTKLVPDSAMLFGGSSFGVVMVDDPPSEGSPAVSRVEVRKTGSGVHLAASVETKLSALLRITQALGNALALDEVLPKVLEGLFNIFPQADRGFIVLVQGDGELVPKWVKTRRPQAETETLRISRTIIREAMTEGSAILSLDASSDARFQSSESIADFRIRSMICAPLINGEGEAIGALQIDTIDQRNRFEEGDVEVLAAVATQAGMAIHSAQLHEQALLQKEVEHDLKLATEVQAAFLPHAAPEIPGFRFHSYYAAANHVGGDYFDYIDLPDGRIGVVVADVVGHGVAAAMYMAKLSAETRFCLASEPSPALAVERLNDRMSDLGVERFVTFLLIVIDPARATATIVNAGHMAPIIRRAGGELIEPGADEAGLPIAIGPGMSYQAVTLPMDEGDVAVLYTDGVNEATNAAGEQFKIERIRRVIAEGGSGKAVADRLIKKLQQHVGPGAAEDDICFVTIERAAPKPSVSDSSLATGSSVIEAEEPKTSA
ncbi:SpoIIE family protein phosphatase [Candidatus Laterigemmans baculatus]|uniref:SpoIIE family protein phosphatase n=1 Tax=Candidatus Laterigemmans baculatus TaxID=2770505 RepID=UPI0013DBFA2A|nr:SpoIIE family protein phosphatase [Candidatus Laterigemmans baculatus]